MVTARLLAALFVCWFSLLGVAGPTLSIAACLDADLSSEAEEKDEADPCPVEELLANPGQQGASRSQAAVGPVQGRGIAHGPPRATARAVAPVPLAHPRPGGALPLRC